MALGYQKFSASDKWIDEFKNGSKQAFDCFFYSYYASVLYFAIKLLKNEAVAEDIVSESFAKIWQRRNQFSHAETLRSYLYSTVKNSSIDWLKQQQRQSDENASYEYVQKELHKVNFEFIVTAEVLRRISEAMEILPEECKKVMKLHFNEGKKIQEVADILNISVSTVKTQKARGLAALRKKLPPAAYTILLPLFLHQ